MVCIYKWNRIDNAQVNHSNILVFGKNVKVGQEMKDKLFKNLYLIFASYIMTWLFWGFFFKVYLLCTFCQIQDAFNMMFLFIWLFIYLCEGWWGLFGLYACLCTTCMWYTKRAEEDDRSPGTRGKMILSSHVVFCKSSHPF